MTKILVMTDIHITPEAGRIIGLDTAARFTETLQAALHDHPDAEMLVLMGDLTHHGDVESYRRLADILGDVPIPVVPMLGNHDRRDAFLAVFCDAPQTADGHIQMVRDFPRHRVITLDTLDGPPYPAGHHSGALCDKRRTWLAKALAGADGRMPLVFAHHPPFETGIVGMDMIKLVDGALLLDMIAPHARAHLFCGHIHRTISGSSRGVAWTMFKSPAHQGVLDLVTADSALSVDEPPAYGVLLLMDDGVVAHSQDVISGATVIQDGGSIAAKSPDLQ